MAVYDGAGPVTDGLLLAPQLPCKRATLALPPNTPSPPTHHIPSTATTMVPVLDDGDGGDGVLHTGGWLVIWTGSDGVRAHPAATTPPSPTLSRSDARIYNPPRH